MWNWIKDWSIRKRIWGLIVFTILLMTITTFVDVLQTRDELAEKKQEQIKHLVESAHSLLGHYGELAKSGDMSLEAAQDAAKQALRTMRYDSNEYFWINDMHPRMVMHPFKPKLEGQDVSKVKDPDGKLLFMEMVKRVKEESQGFVAYQWPKAGSNEPVPKTSFVKGYSPWGWVVGSGVYMDDIENLFWEELTEHSFRLLATLAVFIFLAMLLANSITRPMRRMVNAMNNIASGDADLTQRLEVNGNNEMSEVALGFNTFILRIQEVIQQVSDASKKIDSSSGDLSHIAESSSSSIQGQRSEIEQVATAMNEMAATIHEVANNAVNAADSAGEADKNAHGGSNVVKQTIASIESLATGVIEASEAVNKVKAESENIGSILDVIRSIADQTNLLALNAAIEAARAGDQGRGFAVVADEVRNLAKRTQESTQEIQTKIESLQEGTQHAVNLIEQGRERANISVTHAVSAGEALTSITDAISNICDMNTQIAAASEQQSVVANDMDRNLTVISDQTDGISNDIGNAASSSQLLSLLASDLNILVKQFRIK